MHTDVDEADHDEDGEDRRDDAPRSKRLARRAATEARLELAGSLRQIGVLADRAMEARADLSLIHRPAPPDSAAAVPAPDTRGPSPPWSKSSRSSRPR